MPLDATNITSRSGCCRANVRINSSQQTMPPPRSLAHEYQPLRGVITTSGRRRPLRPLTRAVMLKAVAGVRVAGAAR